MAGKNDSLKDWLAGHGLAGLAPILDAEDVDLEVLPNLTGDDLRELGLSLGNRKKLLKAIESLGGAADAPPAPTLDGGTSREAERRQLTVMFCDVADSTALSERLDPEDLRDIMLAYQQISVEAIQSSGGYPAKYLGDGILAYFGYPQAHEDDPARSVRAGLALLAGVRRLNDDLQARMGLTIGVRIGIHTGLVVAGEMGGGDVKETDAIVGETPNIAARLEGLAAPDGMVIGPLTRELIGDAFDCRFIGEKTVKGISVPIPVHAVVGERSAGDRLAGASTRPSEPLVGREAETALLGDLWASVRGGAGRAAVITGEAGVGKSRLTDEIAVRVRDAGHEVLRLQGSPFRTSSPLHPVGECLAGLAGLDEHDTPDQRLTTLENWLTTLGADAIRDAPQLGAVLHLPVEARYGAQSGAPQLRKRRMLAALVDTLRRLTVDGPLLLIAEDAHWLDPTTLEWLTQMLDEIEAAALMFVATARPEFDNPWRGLADVHELSLDRLDGAASESLILALTGGKPLPPAVTAEILEKADGVPLFVRELTKSLLASEALIEEGDGYRLSESVNLAVPATLQDLLTARLDRLGPGKEVAQIGSAVGRRFSRAMVVPLSTLDAQSVDDAIRSLTQGDLVDAEGAPPDASYLFRHALIRDAAYDSMLRRRRLALHGRIADLIEADYPDLVAAAPEVMARHRTAAGHHAPAVTHWRSAARQALQRGANVEAISHLRQALECLAAQPENEDRMRDELELQCMIGPALMATRGWGSSEPHTAFNRARDLCALVGDPQQAFAALWGIWLFHAAGADLTTGLALIAELFEIAEATKDEELELQAHHAAWGTRCWFGDMEKAIAHVDRGMALYDPDRHRGHAMRFGGHDPGVCAHVQGALTFWYRGYPDLALDRAEDGLSFAHELEHPPSVAHALAWHCHLHFQRRDRARTAEAAAQLAELAKGLALGQYLPPATTFATWANAQTAEPAATIGALRQGLARSQSAGHKGLVIMQKFMLTEALIDAGDLDQAAVEVSDALGLIDAPEPHVSTSDLHRMQGEIAKAKGDVSGAATSLEKSIAVARAQNARSLELRAATAMARFLGDADLSEEALALLAPVHDWFTEGFDTADWLAADSLRRQLA